MPSGPADLELPERIRSRIRVDASGHWLWSGYHDGRSGRPYVTGLDGRNTPVARVVLASVLGGAALAGRHAAHRCDVRRCVRPHHLYAATALENTWDAHARGLAAVGERSGTARLTRAAVADMRRRAAAGETFTALATEYGVSMVTARRAVRGVTWQSCPEPPFTEPRLTRVSRAGLHPDGVVELRAAAMTGERFAALGPRFGVSADMASRVARGLSWADVGGPVDGRSRSLKGEGNGQARLTAEDVASLRLDSARGVPRRVLAERYGITPLHVSGIVRRRSWAHVPGPDGAA